MKDSKLSIAKSLYDSSNKIGALKVVSKFPRLGEEKDAIMLAIGCINNPSFYKQLGYTLDDEINKGIKAMEAKYEW